MKLSSLVSDHLAGMGIPRPAPALVEALEAYAAPRVAALIARTLTRRVVAKAFASTLVEGERLKGSPEGTHASAPALASSPEASCAEQEKPTGVAGAGADAASTVGAP